MMRGNWDNMGTLFPQNGESNGKNMEHEIEATALSFLMLKLHFVDPGY